MKMARSAIALPAVAALGASLLVGTVVPRTAQAADETETITVDFDQTTGEFRGGATGTLYGFGDTGAPTPALINGAHITNTSQKAPFGTQHPSGDSLAIEDDFFAKHGEDLYIYTQDYYPDWAYNGGVRPGDDRTYDLTTGTFRDTPNGVWDYLEVVEFVTEAVATSSSFPESYVHIPFNEPDAGNWYRDWTTMKHVFLADWDAVYETIQSVYARHGLQPARVGGPGDAGYQPRRTADFLDATQASGTLPDVMIWHELGIENLATFRSHLSHYRDLEAARGITEIPVNITEFGMLRDMGTPGQLIQWLAMFEDAKVDAQTAYWNYAGNLSDNSARANAANAGWWMFAWYGDLEGSETVSLVPPQLDVADTLQGIAAVDRENARATVLLGGGRSDSVTLDLQGLDPAVFGGSVDVEVREATLSGAEGLHGTPRVVAAIDSAAVVDGMLEVAVPVYDRYAGYQVVITPAQTRTVTTAPVWQASIEAEDTVVSGAVVYTQNPTDGGGWKFLASGGKDVGSFNGAVSAADWAVTVPRTGSYRFQVIGATPGAPGRHALFVDDEMTSPVQYTADLALTGAQRWQYRGSAEVTIDLTAGDHVLSLRASEDGATVLPGSDITLDKLVLTDVTDGEPTVYPGSTMRLAGGAHVLYDRPGSRGAASVGAGQRADVYATAWDSGYHDVAIAWTSLDTSQVEISVNGRRVAAVDAPQAGSWLSTARLHLSEGINEIELRSEAGALITSLTTTRASEADTSAVTIEAEDAALHGSASVVTVDPTAGSNASGGRYVGSIGGGNESILEVLRSAGIDEPGLYDAVISFANAETRGAHDYNPQVVDRRLDVTEAGGTSPAGSGYFRYTYSWESFWDRTIPVELSTGDAPLLFGNSDGWAPTIDTITVAPVLLGTPTTVPGPTTSVPPVTLSLAPEQPTGTGGWYSSPVEVTASTAEPGAPVTFEIQVDDGAWETATGAVVVDTDGRRTVSARAHGLDGDTSAVTAVEILLDQTAPVTSVGTVPSAARGAVGSSDGSAEASAPVVLTFDAVDTTSGVSSTEYRSDGGDWVQAGLDGLTLTEVGSHEIFFRSTDAAGNVEAEQVTTVDVVAASPSTPAPGATPPGHAGQPGATDPSDRAGSDTSSTPDGGGGLASTGASVLWGSVGAFALLVAGAASILARRRSVSRT